MAGSNLSGQRGMYATACESSKYKNQIDQWLNEGKSNSAISRELEKLGEKISDKSIAKYRSYRDEHIDKELQKDPEYIAKVQKVNEVLVEEVGKIKQVNLLNHLTETIEHCAELIQTSKDDDIRIKNVQDLRFTYMTMLEAIKLTGDIALKAQQMQKIEENPDLLRPTMNVNMKAVLVDLLGGMNDEQRFGFIDRLRTGIGQYVAVGPDGYTVDDRSSSVDGDE